MKASFQQARSKPLMCPVSYRAGETVAFYNIEKMELVRQGSFREEDGRFALSCNLAH